MASRLDSTNVVRLPTAASRKPQNHRFAAQCKAGAALRRAEPWPGEFMFHGQRKALKLAATIREIEITPSMLLAQAICATLDDAARTKVLELLAPGVVHERKASQQALAIFQTSKVTIGEQLDLHSAFERLDRERG